MENNNKIFLSEIILVYIEKYLKTSSMKQDYDTIKKKN